MLNTEANPEAVQQRSAASVFELSPVRVWALLILVFLSVQFAALFSPPLLDDADATHASAAAHIVHSHDWTTLYVNGIRYLEKPPLPYWLVAIDNYLFGFNVFAAHLPLTLAVLGTSIVAWLWARRAYGARAALYAALGLLTSMGVFLFTRILIPEAILSFLLLLSLYCFLTAIEDGEPARLYVTYACLALAVLAKGLIGPVFFVAAAVPYLLWTGTWRQWRNFRLLTGLLLFLAIAAPWHVLAGLRNPDQGHPLGNIPSPGNVHGFFYFYFVNEHILRFLGRRFPHDYSKLPAVLYWTLHLVWLFPWSIFVPVALRNLWKSRELNGTGAAASQLPGAGRQFRRRTTVLLAIYAAFILVFFSLSTNQEYYTFPAYFALIMLLAAALSQTELDDTAQTWLTRTHAALTLVGILASAALFYGLWSARDLPFTSDIGKLLARRAVAGYDLSMSHFFDLTGPSFAALREPALIAALTLMIGPVAAWRLRRRRLHLQSTIAVGLTAATFLVAAHIALVRFGPMLSSAEMAQTVNRYASPADTLMIYGDQSGGSSLIYYTQERLPKPALLVNGKTTSMLWGACYPDAPHIFLDDAGLEHAWGNGERHWLFVPGENQERVTRLLGSRLIEVQESSDKTLYTDRPL